MSMGTATAVAGAMQAGGGLIGQLMTNKTYKDINKRRQPALANILSPRQKQVDQSLYDFLMGVQRDAAGKVTGMDPWLPKLLEKRAGIKQQVAPFTAGQQAVMDQAKGLLSSLGRHQPDPHYLANLKQGILPKDMKNVHFAATGTMVGPGEDVLVGEDGIELVRALPGGGVAVIPNPDTMRDSKSIAQGMRKSKAAEKKYGIKGAAVPKYLFDYDDPLNTGGKKKAYFDVGPTNYRGNYFDPDQAYTQAFQTGFSDWFDQAIAEDRDGKQTGFGWYDTFQNKYGGDIANVEYANPKGKPRVGVQGKIHENYAKYLDRYKQTLPLVHENVDVTTALEMMPQETVEGFGDFLLQNPKYNLGANYELSEGVYGFDDPYAVDTGNLNKAIADYMAQGGYEMIGGGYARPAPMTDGPTTPDDPVPDRTVPDRTGSPDPTEPSSTDTDTTVGTNDQLNQILTALTAYTDQFDPTGSAETFETAVAAPARQYYQETTAPAITKAIGGEHLFGSAHGKAQQKAATDLETALAGNKAAYLQQAEESHRQRGLAASNAMMNLYRLPQESLAQQASIDNVNALTANVFNNMAWTDALNAGNVTNQQLTSLALLWQLVSPEQQYNQAQLDAAMQNAFTEDGGLDIGQIIPWMFGYEDITNYVTY